jgi:hypothetical protein
VADETTDNRRAPRFVTSLPVFLRASGRPRAPVRIVDLSIHGCRVDEAWGLILDGTVWLTLGRLQAVEARAVWTHYSFAGLEFAVPLNQAVLDDLLAGAAQPPEAELAETSRRCESLAAGAFREDTALQLLRLADDCRAEAERAAPRA